MVYFNRFLGSENIAREQKLSLGYQYIVISMFYHYNFNGRPFWIYANKELPRVIIFCFIRILGYENMGVDTNNNVLWCLITNISLFQSFYYYKRRPFWIYANKELPRVINFCLIRFLGYENMGVDTNNNVLWCLVTDISLFQGFTIMMGGHFEFMLIRNYPGLLILVLSEHLGMKIWV